MDNLLDLSYYNIYKNLINKEKSLIKGDTEDRLDFSKKLNLFLKYCLSLLEDLEKNITSTKNNFVESLISNMESSKKYAKYSENLLNMHQKFFDEILSIIENKKVDINNRESLKKVISYIEKRSQEENNFDNIGYKGDVKEKEIDKSKENKVFLSYAHYDKLYTYGLYQYFKDNGVYLHVDWMHNGIISNPFKLKKTLDNDMSKCDQFLFCRSINSELRVKGGQIRQWCSWEIGNYYCKYPNEEFYTQIYNGEVLPGKSSLLNTLKPLKGISKGVMI